MAGGRTKRCLLASKKLFIREFAKLTVVLAHLFLIVVTIGLIDNHRAFESMTVSMAVLWNYCCCCWFLEKIRRCSCSDRTDLVVDLAINLALLHDGTWERGREKQSRCNFVISFWSRSALALRNTEYNNCAAPILSLLRVLFMLLIDLCV